MVSLKVLVIPRKGIKPKLLKKNAFENSVPYLDISTLETGIIKWYTNKELGTLTSENDVLVVWDGSRCGLALQSQTGVIGSTIMGLTPIQILPKYLFYFIKSKYDFININAIGTGIPHVDADLFYGLNIPFISLENQEKIIADLEIKLNNNRAIIDAQKEQILESLQFEKNILFENNDVEKIIKHIKHTIFNKAFSGELSAQWRKQNKIKEKWRENNIETISNLVTSGSREWTKYYSKSGARFIRSQDIKENVINKSRMIYVDLPENIEGKRTFVETGNLLITIIGSNIGKCAMIEEDFQEEGYVNQAIALIKLNEDILPNYVHLYIQSPSAQSQIKSKIYGDAQPALNLKDVREIQIPLPSIEEQLIIVNKVNQLLETVEAIKINFQEILSETYSLEKALLQDVFKENEIHSSIENESLESILNELRIEKGNLETNKKNSNKALVKTRNQMIQSMERNKSVLELLQENKSYVTEDLWKDSVYYKSKNVESFYEELSKLQKEKIITTTFNSDKTQTIIKLL